MYDEDQDVDDLDRLLVCPYESSHKVTASRMNNHLVKCRKNYELTEPKKAICPFNEQHVIFEPEIETHKILCPERPHELTDEDDSSGDENRQDSENEVVCETNKTKAHTKCCSDLETDKESAETGCTNGLEVGGLEDHDVDSTTKDAEETVMMVKSDETTLNGEAETSPENGANEDKCDSEKDSVNAVSHMSGFEPQDDNIAIEKQLSQSKANLSSSNENGVVNETSMNGHGEEEHFDYKKYAPSKEEREEFLKLIKEHKEQQNGVDDKDDSYNQNYVWQHGYSYVTPPYHSNQPYNGLYGPGTTFIAYPNGSYHPAMNNGHPPYHYTFQPGSGPVPQYLPHPVQGYDFNQGFTPRHHYRRPYRGRNSYNRHYNGYNNRNNHYNGHYNHNGHRNHYNHYNNHYNNSYCSHDPYSHTDTDSNSSASGHSDAGSADHSHYNGNGLHSDNDRSHYHHSRRSHHHHSSKGSVNLERIIHVNTDSDGESGPPSINGHILDLSPEPSETYESSLKRKGEKDKVVRKLRKKLNEIHALESKRNSGVKMDCDQLKKLNRKKELEDELAALTID